MDKIINYLGNKILDAQYTVAIGQHFESILPLILMVNVDYDAQPDRSFLIQHRRKCHALAKLVAFSSHAQRFALTYFANMPSPFGGDAIIINNAQKKLPKTTTTDEQPTQLDLLKCCLIFLKLDSVFFKRQWKWSEFIEKFSDDMHKQSDEHRFVYNQIVANLMGLSKAQLKQLNENLPIDVEINFDNETSPRISNETLNEHEHFDSVNGDDALEWDLKSEQYANIEGVLLPIFDSKNAQLAKNSKRIVLVESARSNLKSIAIGVAAGSAVCLSGSVGSGKTTLIEYLAHRTGRIAPKQFENIANSDSNDGNLQISLAAETRKKKNNKRKSSALCVDEQRVSERQSTQRDAFLRIQLGDQTDSKMLLGQYHCTDVPGEFVWQPGVLTQAVMNGYWLLLEDLDQCSRDVCVMLTNFFENNYLSVPGFRDCIQISSGFRLFVTRRYVNH